MSLRITSVLGLLFGVLPAALATLQIVPGATWTASNGKHLQAHGGGVIKVDDTYYLVGEDKTNGSAFQNVNCYSSTDLVQWHYEGALLSVTDSGDLGPSRVVERPKVIYNDNTGKYVLWMHIDSSSYGEAKVGVATGDTVCGNYTYLKSFQPLDYQSRDMNLFKDDNGTAYLLSEDRENGLRINKLTEDYLDVEAATYLWSEHIEAPAMLKYDGRYYMFGSHLTGWTANDNVVSSSTSLTDGWTAWATFADVGSHTYTSQTNDILDYGDGKIMYLGDRWVSSNLASSTYVWLPLTMAGTNVSMANYDAWVPHAGEAAAWQAAPTETAYAGAAGTYAGGARNVSCANCTDGAAAGYIGGPDSGTVTIAGVSKADGSDALTTLIVRYAVSEAAGRLAAVRVNGGTAVQMAFLPGTGTDHTGRSVLTVALQAGSQNTVEFGGVGSAYGPDVDVLLVPGSG